MKEASFGGAKSADKAYRELGWAKKGEPAINPSSGARFSRASDNWGVSEYNIEHFLLAGGQQTAGKRSREDDPRPRDRCLNRLVVNEEVVPTGTQARVVVGVWDT